MRLRLLVTAMLIGTASSFMGATANAGSDPCGDRLAGPCLSDVTADQRAGQFHGLIMVNGQPVVLDAAAHSGTKPGCGDCKWTLIMACVFNSPDDPTQQNSCLGATRSARCRRGQVLYRLYLTTDAT